MSDQSFIKELFERRVPQIAGLYIAATWMMIEIGDWITDRFSTPESVTSYIFIGMLSLLPSVLLVAYQYGKPGKDPWKKATFLFIPGNIVFACFAMFYSISPVVATETKTLIDENGESKTYEVSKQEYRNQLVSFFWRNNSGQAELDWLRYGLAWLLSKDLDRSLFISAYTPFSSNSILTGLTDAGFEASLNAPKSLQLELARKRFLKYSLDGRFDFNNENYILEVDIYNVKSGKLHASHLVKGNNLLSLIDELTINIKKSINVPMDLNEQATDLPVKEHTSESLDAIKDLINAKIEQAFNNNYPASKALLQSATAKDFSFTNAYTHLARTNQLMGITTEATQALAQALKHEYKLTTEEKFLFRGLVYGLRGDYQSQMKIYDMWIELFPEDVDAHQTMVQLLLVTGIDHDKALHSLRQLRRLTPNDDSVLRNLTMLFILRGELDRAVESQQQYTQMNPRDNNGLIELASIYERTSQFDLARETYNRVLLLEMDNIAAAIKIALLELKLGHFETAENQLAKLFANATTDKQKFDILRGYLFFYSTTGQIKKVISTINQMKNHAQHLPPIMKIFELEFTESLYLANIGEFEQATKSLALVKQKLQPPLNSIIEVGAVAAHILANDKESARKSIEELEEYIKQFPNPMLSSTIDSANALLSELDLDFKTAVKLHQRALDSISGNIVNTQSESTILGQQVLLANAKREIGLIEEAKADLLKVVTIFPSFPAAHFRLAQCYLEEKDMPLYKDSIEKAQAAWKNADQEYIEYKKMLAFIVQAELKR